METWKTAAMYDTGTNFGRENGKWVELAQDRAQ
jgi:hypothetical protein